MNAREVTKASPTKAKPDEPEVKVIKLTLIKQWYIPADTESYLLLRSLKVPMLKIHKNFLPTLKLLVQGHNVRAIGVSFKDEILDPFLDKVGATWNKKEHCKCTISSSNMKFETIRPEVFETAKRSIPKLQEVLDRFFRRWGFRAHFEYSEARGKLKLNVDYKFDSELMPLLDLEAPVEPLPQIKLKLGFTRITLTFGDKFIDLLVESSQGGNFKPIHSGKCLYSQVSSVRPLIHALMTVPTHDVYNFENPPD